MTQDTPKSREKDKLSFYAYKVEQLEKDSEKHEAKQLRDRFFGLERHLRSDLVIRFWTSLSFRMFSIIRRFSHCHTEKVVFVTLICFSISISKAKNKEARKAAGLPLKHPRNERPGDFGRNVDWNRDMGNMGKFKGLQPFPPAKRYKPGPADFRFDPYTGRGLEVCDLFCRVMDQISIHVNG